MSRQLLGVLTAAVEAAGRAAESWLLPGRGTAAAAAAAAAAEPRLESVEVAIVAAVELLSCVSKRPVGEEWPAPCQWLLAGGGMQALSAAVLHCVAFIKGPLMWIAISPAVIAVDMYSHQRVSGTDAIWRDPSLAEGMKRHLSLMLCACALDGGAALEDVIARSFHPMAIAAEVMPSLAEQLHPDLLRLWPHLFSSLQLTIGWEPVEAVVPSFLRLIDALPSAVKCAHWLQHCSIAVDAMSLAFDALDKSERPEPAGISKGERRSGAAALVGRAVGMIHSLSKLPN